MFLTDRPADAQIQVTVHWQSTQQGHALNFTTAPFQLAEGKKIKSFHSHTVSTDSSVQSIRGPSSWHPISTTTLPCSFTPY